MVATPVTEGASSREFACPSRFESRTARTQRNVAPPLVDRFVGMYVNDLTVAYGSRGRAAVALLLDRGYAQGLLPRRIVPEYVE